MHVVIVEWGGVCWDSGPRAVITNNGGTSTPSHTWHLCPGSCRHSCPLNPELLLSLDPLQSSPGEARESPSSVLEFLAVGSCSPIHWKPQDIIHPASSLSVSGLHYFHHMDPAIPPRAQWFEKCYLSKNSIDQVITKDSVATQHLLSTNCKIPPKATTLKLPIGAWCGSLRL